MTKKRPVEIRIDALMDVYMSGFLTGAGSVLHTMFPDRDEYPEAVLDREAEAYVDAVNRDPLMCLALREQVVEIVEGRDSGPYTMYSTEKP